MADQEDDDLMINYPSDEQSSGRVEKKTTGNGLLMASGPFVRWPMATALESYFDLEASSDVTVVVGQAAFLVCRVAVAGNWTVRHFLPLIVNKKMATIQM